MLQVAPTKAALVLGVWLFSGFLRLRPGSAPDFCREIVAISFARVGDNFAWINPQRVDDYDAAPEVHTLPVGIENLQATLAAAEVAMARCARIR